MLMTEAHMQIMRHSIGIDMMPWYKMERITADPYRNYFATTPWGEDYLLILDLVKDGLMEGPFQKVKMEYFIVTDKGIELARESAIDYAKKTKPSRSKARYIAYLHSESGESFIDWLKNHYWDDYRKRYQA